VERDNSPPTNGNRSKGQARLSAATRT